MTINTSNYIPSISLILFFAVSLPSQSADRIGETCVYHTVTSSEGDVWPNKTCWDIYSDNPDPDQLDPDPFFDDHGGGGFPNSGLTHAVYAGNDLDEDADSAIDCWKDITESGDYDLEFDQDFGPRPSGKHNGIDIAAVLGTPIFSSAYMRITRLDPNGIYNTIENPQTGNGAHVGGEFISMARSINWFIFIWKAVLLLLKWDKLYIPEIILVM
jgi:hypothetical protein